MQYMHISSGWMKQFYIGQANQSNIHNFQPFNLFLYLLMIIGPVAAWSARPVPRWFILIACGIKIVSVA